MTQGGERIGSPSSCSPLRENIALGSPDLGAVSFWTPADLTVPPGGVMNVTAMHLETRFLKLRTPVTLGSRFGDWEVSWLGGWSRHRLYYLVMLVRVAHREQPNGNQ